MSEIGIATQPWPECCAGHAFVEASANMSRKNSAAARSICLVSRQRIVGKTNGSSVYVLSIVEYLKSKGFRVHYVSPSPATFGRWPFIRLRREMDVFDSVRIRGSVKLGRFLVLLDPTVLWRAAIAVLDRFIARTGLSEKRFGRPAPYSIAVDLSPRDCEFLAKHVPKLADVLLLDYAFMTPCIQYVSRAGLPSIVIMHDLFSARGPQFQSLNKTDSAAAISEAKEMTLLSAADLVVAIQADEAATVRDRLPGQRVVVAPMAVKPVDQVWLGQADTVLFVGSNTAPNIDALQWLIEDIWPLILHRRPSSRLLVAGSVAWAYSPAVPSVEYLGVVSDLGALYRRAGVVISPLRVGSGLKVKLVEAMGWGKAVVATGVTAQGIQSLVKDAMLIADTAEEFAEATLSLMNDENRRKRYAKSALQVARAHFGEESCYRELLSFIVEWSAAWESSNGVIASRRTSRMARSAALEHTAAMATGRPDKVAPPLP
jgi:glycosyltransferase involved in cell wall biosynthesis